MGLHVLIYFFEDCFEVASIIYDSATFPETACEPWPCFADEYQKHMDLPCEVRLEDGQAFGRLIIGQAHQIHSFIISSCP